MGSVKSHEQRNGGYEQNGGASRKRLRLRRAVDSAGRAETGGSWFRFN